MGFEDKVNSAFSKGIHNYMIAVHYVKEIGNNKEKGKIVEKNIENTQKIEEDEQEFV